MARQRLLMLLDCEQAGRLELMLHEGAPALAAIAASIGGSLRLAVQHENDMLAEPAASSERAIRTLRGLVEVTIPGDTPETLLSIAAALAGQLEGNVDWSNSSVSVGTVHELLPAASDTVLLTLAATRRPDLDRAAFHRYWLEQHAALALSLLDDAGKSVMGYQQVHADERASALAAQLVGAPASTFDGVLQCSLNRIQDLPHLNVPGFAEAIERDEEHFADQSAVMLGAFMRTLPLRAARL